jgi:surface protein
MKQKIKNIFQNKVVTIIIITFILITVGIFIWGFLTNWGKGDLETQLKHSDERLRKAIANIKLSQNKIKTTEKQLQKVRKEYIDAIKNRKQLDKKIKDAEDNDKKIKDAEDNDKKVIESTKIALKATEIAKEKISTSKKSLCNQQILVDKDICVNCNKWFDNNLKICRIYTNGPIKCSENERLYQNPLMDDRKCYYVIESRTILDALITKTPNGLGEYIFKTNNYGPIRQWKLAPTVNDLSYLFHKSSFNKDISGWHVGNVTDMNNMFYGADKFNGDISRWDVGNVKNMENTFRGANSFNIDISGWNVNNVENAKNMFRKTSGPHVFNQNLSWWWRNKTKSQLSLDTDLSHTSFNMLPNCKRPIMTINEVIISNETKKQINEMSDLEKLVFYRQMAGCVDFIPNRDILDILIQNKKWDGQMDGKNYGPIKNWVFSPQIKDLSKLFLNNTTFNKDISGWDVSQVTNMESMFEGAILFNQPLNNWDVSNVLIMRSMFKGAILFNQPLNNWDISNVLIMRSMFEGAASFDQPLNNWNISNVLIMYDMFAYTQYSTNNKIPYNVNMFINLNIVSTRYILEYLITNEIWDGLLGRRNYGPIKNWIIHVEDLTGLFKNKSSFNKDISGWDVSQVKNMKSMFDMVDTTGSTSFNQPLNNWDVGNVIDMSYMFRSCGKNQNDASKCFNQPLNNWDVSNVTNMEGMFYRTWNFSQSLNNWNVSKVTNMKRMFSRTSSFNGDLSNWNVSNVTDMSYMFYFSSFNRNINTKTIDRNGQTYQAWNVSKVTNMEGMFQATFKFNQSLNKWDISKVTNMKSMFSDAAEFSQFTGSIVNGWKDKFNPNVNTQYYLLRAG